ncbi:flavin-linked sulfhydryl oxidase [Saccharomycopsis crataegensis]|uniref:Sulfhydryl oxidase n=1 Tax=Saccharomycopsis crataegensis TaxID=43959 RepID=A0AAV5QUX1_9ASCO|nr:flavin-linked sulfhydryl oxidase [Saccharomycopsis crataegensis]
MIRLAKRPIILTLIFSFVILSVFYTSKSNNQISIDAPRFNKETTIGVSSSSSSSSHSSTTSTNNNDNEVQKESISTNDNNNEIPKESMTTKNNHNNNDNNNDSNIGEDTGLKAFMPKMENATLKAELGRSTWKLLHNVLARYPDHPTDTEKDSLKQFFNYFVQVYPCGDCAQHFQKLLDKFPPQVNSKQTAALWGCHIHNKVNERLQKPIYDCTGILNDYDCGCGGEGEGEGEDDAEQNEFKSLSSSSGSSRDKEKFQVGIIDSNKETIEHLESIKIESSEEYQRGG